MKRLVAAVAIVAGLWSAYCLYGLVFDIGIGGPACRANYRCEMDPKIQNWIVGVILIVALGSVIAVSRRRREQ